MSEHFTIAVRVTKGSPYDSPLSRIQWGQTISIDVAPMNIKNWEKIVAEKIARSLAEFYDQEVMKLEGVDYDSD